jgi:phosphoenolpyruvate-protein phosphotransferase/dihydroxyacetone kinase phosphotransfer subunit
MVGLVLVAHSKKLAETLRELVLQWTGPHFHIAVAAGVGEKHEELGTDAVHIAEVLRPFCEGDGVVVLMDMGSAVLSAEVALELLDPVHREKVRLCAAPLVEGVFTAAVLANGGNDLDSIARESVRALAPKEEQLRSGRLQLAKNTAATPSVLSAMDGMLLVVENDHGLHARPAAALVQAASKYSAEIEISNETTGRGPVSARSLTSVALLQVRQGHRIRVQARGQDAEAALREILILVTNRFGESSAAAKTSRETVSAALATPPVPLAAPESVRLIGTAVSNGIATGPLLTLHSVLPTEKDGPPDEPGVELSNLINAMHRVQRQLSRQASQVQSSLGGESAQILAAQALILNDPVLKERAKLLLYRDSLTAAQVWRLLTDELAASYQAMDDGYSRERAADVRDIAGRVLGELQGQQAPVSISPPEPSVLFARELLPSEAAACDPSRVLGVITAYGSPTSHSAILLRTVGIPMVVGIGELNGAVGTNRVIAMDGVTGEVWLSPSETVLQTLEQRKRDWLTQRQAAERVGNRPSITLDGKRIEVLANVGNNFDALLATRSGADGVGLLRTEFCFLGNKNEPLEEEQRQVLQKVLDPIPTENPIVVRTFDLGADKALPFLAEPEEDNPFLGVRGIRLCLKHPEFFLAHLRAILEAGQGYNLWLMLPMVAVAEELQQARELLQQAHLQLEADARPHAWPVKVGVMIEVPAAALLAQQLAEVAEFFSIGTNDLTQYVLAAERGNSELTGLQDALHPAVLQLIKWVVDGAKTRARHVAICGDAASDPVAASVFVGLGVHSLSVRPNQIAEIKALFRRMECSGAEKLAAAALAAGNAAQVRELARQYLESGYPGSSSKLVAELVSPSGMVETRISKGHD